MGLRLRELLQRPTLDVCVYVCVGVLGRGGGWGDALCQWLGSSYSSMTSGGVFPAAKRRRASIRYLYQARDMWYGGSMREENIFGIVIGLK